MGPSCIFAVQSSTTFYSISILHLDFANIYLQKNAEDKTRKIRCPITSGTQLRTDIILDKSHPNDNSWSIYWQYMQPLQVRLGYQKLNGAPPEIGLPSDTDSSRWNSISRNSLLLLSMLSQTWWTVGFTGHRGGLHWPLPECGRCRAEYCNPQWISNTSCLSVTGWALQKSKFMVVVVFIMSQKK